MSSKYLSAVGALISKTGGWKVWTAAIVGFLLGAWAFAAEAADVRLSWQHTATTCADGTPTTNCPLTQFRVEKQNGAAWDALASVAPDVFTYLHQNVPPGTHTYRVLAISQQAVSAPSDTATKVIPTTEPQPPTNVVIALNVTIGGQVVRVDPVPAYGVLASGARSATVYGFVRAGTLCLGDPVFTYRGETYRRVARADVGWWRTTANDNAAAPCRSTG